MRTVLTVGREPDNDLVINLPIVSGHHARVTWEGVAGQALIEDLGSSNGTAIGQLDRKITRSKIASTDTVYFGNHPVPAADLLAWVDPSMAPSLVLQGAEMIVGRDPSCHRVIDRVTVSSRHARFRREGERIVVEDLGSSNGTFVNGQRIDRPTEVRPGDLIGLGVDAFRLATGPPAVARTQRLDAIRPSMTPPSTPTIQVSLAPSTGVPSASTGPDWAYPMTLLGLVLQAPVVGLAIGLISGSRANISSPAVGQATFLLGLAALWFGLSTAVFGLLLDPKRPENGTALDPSCWRTRWPVLLGLTIVECMLGLGALFAMGCLRGPVLPELVVLVLASGVGLAAGSLIVLLAPRWSIAGACVAVVLVGFCLFGAGPWSLSRSTTIARVLSNASPSRWAFEGLLDSESEGRESPSTLSGLERDVAEDYFPADTERMGTRAASTALGSMFLGLVGLGVFLVRFSGAGR